METLRIVLVFFVNKTIRQCRHKSYDILRKVVIGKKWKTKAYTDTTYQINSGAEEKAAGEDKPRTTVGLQTQCFGFCELERHGETFRHRTEAGRTRIAGFVDGETKASGRN